MATLLSDRPFSGVRQMKYEQMLERSPATVEAMSTRELEDLLDAMESFYLRRTMELLEGCMQACGATEVLKASDWAAYDRAVAQAQQMAREMALQETLEA